MSWYEEEISIKRKTIYNIWGMVLFIWAFITMTIISYMSLFVMIPSTPGTTLLLVVSMQQFILIFGLMMALQND